jgi:hypothetical protein
MRQPPRYDLLIHGKKYGPRGSLADSDSMKKRNPKSGHCLDVVSRDVLDNERLLQSTLFRGVEKKQPDTVGT